LIHARQTISGGMMSTFDLLHVQRSVTYKNGTLVMRL